MKHMYSPMKRVGALGLTAALCLGMLPTATLAAETADLRLSVGESATISPADYDLPEGGDWASGDETVATVEDGVVTGVSEGETTVSYTYEVETQVEITPEPTSEPTPTPEVSQLPDPLPAEKPDALPSEEPKAEESAPVNSEDPDEGETLPDQEAELPEAGADGEGADEKTSSLPDVVAPDLGGDRTEGENADSQAGTSSDETASDNENEASLMPIDGHESSSREELDQTVTQPEPASQPDQGQVSIDEDPVPQAGQPGDDQGAEEPSEGNDGPTYQTVTTTHRKTWTVKVTAPEVSGVVEIDSWDALVASVETASDGRTRQLTQDITATSSLTITGEYTLDLNGKTLTCSGTNPALFTVAEGGTLTILDSSTQGVAETISYEVMTSIANKDKTTEIKETRTIDVPQSGKILLTTGTGNDNGVVTVSGGTLNLKGGTIDCATKSVSHGILVDGGTVNMSGGTIVNGKADWYQSGGGVLIKNKGTLNLSGGVIAHNFAEGIDAHAAGGGVCVMNGTLNMTGGAIANNRGVYWGGGIALENGALNISGGIIANNTSKVGGGIAAKKSNGTIDISGNAVIAGNSTMEYGGGGGIAADGDTYAVTVSGDALITKNEAKSNGGGIDCRSSNSTLTVTGGQITGNEAHTGGGINSGSKFKMTGGIVADNIARGNTGGDTDGDGEGGGIRIGGGRAEITGGYITNNETRTTVDWGGGGIFISQGAKIELQNLLITGNEAQGLGGGIGGCSTGQLAISATDGVASFDNTAHGNKESGAHAPHKWQDQAALKNDDFLRYGSNDFFCAHTSYVSDAMLGGGSANWHGSQDTGAGYRGDSAENGEIDVKMLAIPKGGAAAAAHLMGLSADPSEEDIDKAYNAAKVFITGNKSSTHGGGIMCNGIMFIGAIEETTTSFSSIPVEAQKVFQNTNNTVIELKGGEFTFALVKAEDLKIKDGKPSYTNAQTALNDANGRVLFTIDGLTQVGEYTYYLVEEPGTGLIAYDPVIYKVTVEVTTSQNISWEIDTKLTATIYGGKVTSIVPMAVNEKGELEEAAAEATDSALFTNTYNGELTVNKVWAGDTGEITHPESVQVQLYKNGVAEGEAVTLDQSNDWTHIWTGLEYGAEYTVKEVDVPENYKATQSQTGSTVTITNTYVPPVTPSTPQPSTNPEPETVDVSVHKDWDWNKVENHPTIAEVTVQLYADGKAVEGKTLTLNSENDWTDTWYDLPKFQADDTTEIVYSVREVGEEDGKITITHDDHNHQFIVTYRMTRDEQTGNLVITVTNKLDPASIPTPPTTTPTPTRDPDDDDNGDDDPEPSPKPTPSPEPKPEPSATPEPEPEVTPVPEPVELIDEPTPLGDLPGTDDALVPDREEFEDLDGDDVPLAEVPATGDSALSWLSAALGSTLGLAWVTMGRRKKEDGEQ